MNLFRKSWVIALFTLVISAFLNLFSKLLGLGTLEFTSIFLSPYLVGYVYTYKFKEKISKETKIRAIIYLLIFVLLTNISSLISGGYLGKIGVLFVSIILVVALIIVSLVVYASFDLGSNMTLKYFEKLKEKKKKSKS